MLRRTFLMTGAALAVASIATMASAQPGGGFGGGFGGGMMGGGASITGLLAMPTVQTELKVTDDQKSKIQELSSTMRDKMREAFNAGGGGPPDFQSMSQEERQKAMGEMRKKIQGVNKELDEQAVKILTAEQVDRAKQLQLQREGAAALTRDDVVKKLGLKDDQTAKIKKLQESLTSQRPRFDPNGDMQAQMQKFRENVTKTQKDMLAVLTDEQTAKWKEICGKPFTFPQRRGFGRGGAGGGGLGGGGGT